jgi:hypothetical protein
MNMLVRSAAAIAVVPAIAHASPVLVEVPHADPIFAAIEAHKRAVARWDEIFVQMGRLEDEISHEKRRTAYYAGCDSLQIIETDDPRWIALNVECENAYEAEQDATLGFTTVFPTTLQGVLDLLTYAVQQEVKGPHLAHRRPHGRRGSRFPEIWRKLVLFQSIATSFQLSTS